MRTLISNCALAIASLFFVTTAVAQQNKPAPGTSDGQLTAAIGDLPNAAQEKMRTSIQRFLNSNAPLSARGASDLGWDCFAAGALADSGVPNADQRLKAIADQLVAKAIPAKAGTAGWAYEGGTPKVCPEGGYDAFADGTCNSKSTTYSFQTGLAIACLAKAGAVLTRSDYLAKAQEAMNYWNAFAITGKPCADCTYYWYSDSPNDRSRYVRNVNIFMGYGAALLGTANGQPSDIKIADQVMRADIEERRAGNKGYLGVDDAEWIAKRADASRNIENHSAAMAVVIDQTGVVLGSSADRAHAKAVWEDWATCDTKNCKAMKCNYWGGDATQCQATLTAAHCAFRKVDPRADAQCREFLSRVGTLSSFGIWSVMVGANR